MEIHQNKGKFTVSFGSEAPKEFTLDETFSSLAGKFEEKVYFRDPDGNLLSAKEKINDWRNQALHVTKEGSDKTWVFCLAHHSDSSSLSSFLNMAT